MKLLLQGCQLLKENCAKFSESIKSLEDKFQELQQAQSSASSVASAASTNASTAAEKAVTALKMAKEFPKNFHLPNKPQDDGRGNRNFTSRFIKVNGWVQWNTPQMEESKLSLNEARKLYTALMQFLFDNGLKAFIDTERTESMMDRRISFTQIFLWFDTPIESKTPWKFLKNLKEDFLLVEPHLSNADFKFSLEMPEDREQTYEMAGRFFELGKIIWCGLTVED